MTSRTKGEWFNNFLTTVLWYKKACRFSKIAWRHIRTIPSIDTNICFFKDFTSMELWLQEIARRYASSVILKTIGTSVERRSIYVVTINDKFVDKPIILLEGGAHPREWISASSILYLIEKIASFTGSGSAVNDVTVLGGGAQWFCDDSSAP